MNDMTFWNWVDTSHYDFVDFVIDMHNERPANENDSTEPNAPKTI
jgi:hypothetical protein